MSQRASVTSIEDIDLDSQYNTAKKNFHKEEIENIIRKRADDSSDPRHSKPTDCDLIALQKVIVFVI